MCACVCVICLCNDHNRDIISIPMLLLCGKIKCYCFFSSQSNNPLQVTSQKQFQSWKTHVQLRACTVLFVVYSKGLLILNCLRVKMKAELKIRRKKKVTWLSDTWLHLIFTFFFSQQWRQMSVKLKHIKSRSIFKWLFIGILGV